MSQTNTADYLIHDDSHHSTGNTVGETITLNPVAVHRWFRKMTLYYSLVVVTSIALVIRDSTGNDCWNRLGGWNISMSVVYLLNTVVMWARYHYRDQQATECARHFYQCLDLVYFILVGTGHIFLIEYHQCETLEPLLYKYSIYLILHNYFLLLVVLFMGVLYLTCLPCFIYVVRPWLETTSGLSEPQLNKIPAVTYRNLPTTDQDVACAICLEDFGQNDIVLEIPCKHRFHQKCLQDWLRINAICPLCRAPVVADEVEL